MKKSFKKKFLYVFSLLIVIALCFSCSPNFSGEELQPHEGGQDTQYQHSENISFTLEDFNSKINTIVEELRPSVVSIQAGIFTEDMMGDQEIYPIIGSGVILDQNGYILTNSHVVIDADELMVVLDDGTSLEATLIGANQQTDVGVIKIEAENLKPATLGSIDDQSVGDLVIALGSPFGIQQTVTFGIISGKERIIPSPADYLPIVDAIQTDAAINPGNSGGPLVNVSGEVIGINTLGISPTGASVGIGFAIPIDTAINIAEQIIEYGRAKIPYMGIAFTQNDSDVTGALIADVAQDSPADNIGLSQGDIIVEFDGIEIKSPFGILSRLLRRACGDEVQLKIYRDGEYMVQTIELEECPTSI